jgi:hypothetical protein
VRLGLVHKTHARVLPCFENSRNVETTGYFLLQDRRAEWDYSDSGGTANSQIDLRKKGQVDHDDDRLALVAVTAID